jgi:hypothetical protein
LQDRIAHLFLLAKELVDREHTGAASQGTNGASENGAVAGNEPAIRRATRRQITAICAIANERQLDLAAELQSRFGHDRPDDLSITEASDPIDVLKRKCTEGSSQRNGQPDTENLADDPVET